MNINWLTSLWRPRIKETTKSNPNTQSNLWDKCPKCQEIEHHKNWRNNLYVCPKCKYHKAISASSRFDIIFDKHTIIELPKTKRDPLQFKDRKKYSDRLLELETANLHEAIALAKGTIDGQNAIVTAMDFGFIGGSMGMFVGQAIVTACNLAISTNTPLICFAESGGARMQEGIYSLMQMPRTVLAVEMLKTRAIPFIVVLTNPCMGGVLASFASLGDITLAEPNATIGFSGRRVIESTIRQTLPEDFQTSHFQYNCGFVDQILERAELKHKLGSLLKIINQGKI